MALRLHGCRRPSLREAERLTLLLDRAATGIGLRHTPQMLIKEQRDTATWIAHGHLVVTSGMLDALEDEQACAVLAQALARWDERDPASHYASLVLASPLILFHTLVDSLMELLRNLHHQERQLFLFVALLGLLLAPLWLYTRLWLRLLVATLRWETETQVREADLVTLHAGFGRGLLLGLQTTAESVPSGRYEMKGLFWPEPRPSAARIEVVARALEREKWEGRVPPATVPRWARP